MLNRVQYSLDNRGDPVQVLALESGVRLVEELHVRIHHLSHSLPVPPAPRHHHLRDLPHRIRELVSDQVDVHGSHRSRLLLQSLGEGVELQEKIRRAASAEHDPQNRPLSFALGVVQGEGVWPGDAHEVHPRLRQPGELRALPGQIPHCHASHEPVVGLHGLDTVVAHDLLQVGLAIPAVKLRGVILPPHPQVLLPGHRLVPRVVQREQILPPGPDEVHGPVAQHPRGDPRRGGEDHAVPGLDWERGQHEEGAVLDSAEAHLHPGVVGLQHKGVALGVAGGRGQGPQLPLRNPLQAVVLLDLRLHHRRRVRIRVLPLRPRRRLQRHQQRVVQHRYPRVQPSLPAVPLGLHPLQKMRHDGGIKSKAMGLVGELDAEEDAQLVEQPRCLGEAVDVMLRPRVPDVVVLQGLEPVLELPPGVLGQGHLPLGHRLHGGCGDLRNNPGDRLASCGGG
mmetsp:Transcript_25084/g.64069  ORF Transcript_25084/g.64069 Transcript_25084/m.64069 type:complete len:451 (-) Transcript_25084:332-1684(-)